MLEHRPVPAPDEVHDCELCRALLGLASSAVANRAAAEQRRATMRVVDPQPAMRRRPR